MDQYEHLHAEPQGAGDARPTALQIIKDNNLSNALADKVIIITGCSSGIGIETARALATTGATLYLPVRNIQKGQSALASLLPSEKIHLMKLDLSSLDSVRTFAATFLEHSSKLNILINNAGIMATPKLTFTKDNFESQFATNHLAHFLLFQLLKPTLLASSTPTFNSRVVSLASSGHRRSSIIFPDINFQANPESYQPFVAYGQSKTANIHMANAIERRYGSRGLHALSLHPGGIWTGLQVNMPGIDEWKKNPQAMKGMKSVEQGAATTVWAAVGKVWEGTGGKYLEDCGVSKPAKEDAQPGTPGHAAWAYDEEAEERLWKESCTMVRVADDN